MKFKLDENLGRAAAAVLLEAGFDVLTISDQQMEGALDRDVIECCVREERCLVTLDANSETRCCTRPAAITALSFCAFPPA